MLGCTGGTPDAFRAELKRVLANRSAALSAPALALLQGIPQIRLEEILSQEIGKVPGYFEALTETVLSGGAPLPQIFTRNLTIYRRNKVVRAFNTLIPKITLNRPVIGLSERDLAVLNATAEAYAENPKDIDAWARFFPNFVWHDGGCSIDIPQTATRHAKFAPVVKKCLSALIADAQDRYEVVLEAAAKRAAQSTSPSVQRHLTQGAHWLSSAELSRSSQVTHGHKPQSLLLGTDDTGKDVYFSGPESLITIGPPNARKTQAHVITNLLSYPGSAFVLDVKDELWQETAGHRQKHFGPVYRFAPTDPTGHSHAYNPFDFISSDPALASLDCQALAHQIMPVNPNLKEPYWENRGRQFLTAFALVIALKAKPQLRNLVSLAEFFAFSMPMGKKSNAPEMRRLVKTMRNLYDKHRLTPLKEAANAIDTATQQDDITRIESVFDQARRFIGDFAIAPHIRRALSKSDWQPKTLRSQPGTTVYFCLKPGDLESFAPLARLVFQQHAAQLTKDFLYDPKTLPITFFLDEMPQLGNMPSLHTLLDVGRGAGVRLWMFAQYLGQIRAHYGRRADGLIMSCAVRSFMSPDNDAVKFIAPTLGTTRHLFSGKQRPLAEPYELLGPAFAGKIITLVRDEHPVLLDRVLAYERFPKSTRLPPPRV